MQERNVLVRLVILALLLYSLVNYAAVRGELAQQEADTRVLAARREELLVQRQSMQAQLDAAEDAAVMRRLAWERLRMVMPGETVFVFTQGD